MLTSTMYQSGEAFLSPQPTITTGDSAKKPAKRPVWEIAFRTRLVPHNDETPGLPVDSRRSQPASLQYPPQYFFRDCGSLVGAHGSANFDSIFDIHVGRTLDHRYSGEMASALLFFTSWKRFPSNIFVTDLSV
jgi:hypothetical protein